MRISRFVGSSLAGLVCCLLNLNALGELSPAFHQVVARAQRTSNGGTGSVDLRTSADDQFLLSSPPDEIFIAKQSVAHAETFGGSGGAPYHAVATASAESLVEDDQEPNGFNQSTSAEASAILQYYSHTQATNDTGLVWHPAVVPVEIKSAGHVSGWGNADVSIRNALSNELYFADSAKGLDYATPKLSFQRTVSLSLPVDTYLTTVMTVKANTFHTLNPNIDTMISSQAEADPIITFDQPAFDLYAAQQGQPTFQLESFYAFEFSPGIGNSVPEPAAIGPWIVSVLLLTSRVRMKREMKRQ